MMEVERDFWWDNLHSGSEAIENARKFLADSRGFAQEPGIDAFAMAQICSELIFRVTGERVTPARGFYWDRDRSAIEGPLFTRVVFEK